MRASGESDPDEDYDVNEDLALDDNASVTSDDGQTRTPVPSGSPTTAMTSHRGLKSVAEQTVHHMRRRLTAFMKVCITYSLAWVCANTQRYLSQERLATPKKLDATFTTSSPKQHSYGLKVKSRRQRRRRG